MNLSKQNFIAVGVCQAQARTADGEFLFAGRKLYMVAHYFGLPKLRIFVFVGTFADVVVIKQTEHTADNDKAVVREKDPEGRYIRCTPDTVTAFTGFKAVSLEGILNCIYRFDVL